jgi:uncharacterized protein YerC
MTNVITRKIPSEVKEEAWTILLRAIKASNSPSVLRKKLARFLTPTEFVLLEKRLAILTLLGHGASYKAIGRIIDVSPATISFVKYDLVRSALRDQIRTARGIRKPKTPVFKVPHFENYGPLAMDYARIKRNQRMYRQH